MRHNVILYGALSTIYVAVSAFWHSFLVHSFISCVLGPGLVFAVWPTALSSLSGAQAWLVLFFLMLLLIGLDSQFVFVYTIVTAIHDELLVCQPRLDKQQQQHRGRWLLGWCGGGGRGQRRVILALLCVVMFLCGLPLCTKVM